MSAKERDKRIIEAAHAYLAAIQEATGDEDKLRLVVGAIAALILVGKHFGCSTIEIMMELRRRGL
jgi:diacylglycerol kinase